LWRIVIENNDNRSLAWIKKIIKEKNVYVDGGEAAKSLPQQRTSIRAQSSVIYMEVLNLLMIKLYF